MGALINSLGADRIEYRGIINIADCNIHNLCICQVAVTYHKPDRVNAALRKIRIEHKPAMAIAAVGKGGIGRHIFGCQGQQIQIIIRGGYYKFKMPILNGIHTAVAIRALEDAFGQSPAPIVFMTGVELDANLQKVVRYVAPAVYVGKGDALTPDTLTTLLRDAVGSLSAGETSAAPPSGA